MAGPSLARLRVRRAAATPLVVPYCPKYSEPIKQRLAQLRQEFDRMDGDWEQWRKRFQFVLEQALMALKLDPGELQALIADLQAAVDALDAKVSGVGSGAGATSIAGKSLIAQGDANLSITLGGNHLKALLEATSITLAWVGQLSLARGGTGAALSGPGADRMLFWDQSGSGVTWLSAGNSLAITGTTLDTTQDIRTSASPTFAGLMLSGYLGINRLAFTATADTTVANTTDETTLAGVGAGSLSLAADFLTVGRTLRLVASGTFANDQAGQVLTLRVKCGGATVALAPAVANPDAQAWSLRAQLVGRAVGIGGTAFMSADYMDSGQVLPVNPGTPQALDTTGVNALDLTAQWDVGAPGATITCNQLMLEVLN